MQPRGDSPTPKYAYCRPARGAEANGIEILAALHKELAPAEEPRDLVILQAALIDLNLGVVRPNVGVCGGE